MITREKSTRTPRHGCTFETHRGGSGHITVRRGNAGANAQCMHGSRKELGTKLVNKILKELGLK
jgi:mRNA interferase HicA